MEKITQRKMRGLKIYILNRQCCHFAGIFNVFLFEQIYKTLSVFEFSLWFSVLLILSNKNH
jgi:hypothetical protein